MKVLFVIACSLSATLGCAQEVHMPLNEGWQFQQAGKDQWYSAEVPGVVQTDLLRHGLIPDFYKGSNIDSVQWIENEDWIYKRAILVTDTLLEHGHLDLVFKGLDTFAEVYLNDSLIGKADNMFRTWEWSIKPLLHLGENELKIIFRSPIKEGAKLREAYGIQLPHDNDPSGVSPYIRKAAYQFGWDFCPRLVTSGIWKEVELRGWDWVQAMELEYLHRGVLHASVLQNWQLGMNIISDREGVVEVVVSIDGVEKVRQDHTLGTGDNYMVCEWGMKNVALWFPSGMGQQHLYRAVVEVRHNGTVVARDERSVGVRVIDWGLNADATGREFKFTVNGAPCFMRGCNLVPPSMVPIGDEDWVDLVRLMDGSGMNMVRVWAGGIYPPDAFFNACDTAGILVWQDLMFANMVPGTLGFLKNTDQEILDQLERWEGHPSIAILCGNNELEVAWKNWGWQDRYALHGEDSIRVNQENWDFFREHFRGLALDHNYLRTSPLSNWGSAEGLRSGDLHYWGVWHGDSIFSSFKNNVGRFVSEYGFQSYPDSALLAHYIEPEQLYLGSPAMKRLQRSYKTDRPIWEAIERELGEGQPTTLGTFIEASQRAQALAYEVAIEAHLDARPHCMGTLLWQLNDCWPGPSWSIIDFEGRPKPAFEVVRRLYTGAR